ncbi:hypothetical protein Tco_1399743 [Tanacetum coccineum]
MKTFREKAKKVEHVRGDFTLQYKQLRDYVMELQPSNPNTTVRIGVESKADHMCLTRIFKRMYVCLGAANEGFKACMREYQMKRIVIMKQVIEKSDGPLTPIATKFFNVVKAEASECIAQMVGICMGLQVLGVMYVWLMCITSFAVAGDRNSQGCHVSMHLPVIGTWQLTTWRLVFQKVGCILVIG